MPQRPIKDVIAKQKIVTSPPSTTVREAAKAMKQRNVSSVLIVNAGRLVGIFTERDAVSRVLAEGRDANATKLADVMTRKPKTIGPDKPVGFALLMMYEGGFRHVPVVKDGHPVGLISARDALGPELQEFESELERRKRIGEILG
jgi:CBS domain-containing protein